MSSLRPRLVRTVDRLMHRDVALGPHRILTVPDLRVPMGDGIELRGDLYQPVPADPERPTVVIRGPYGRRGLVAGAARLLAYRGFPVFFVSCRGTFGSGGVFTPQIDEQRDGIATLQWVRQQPWFTDRLAMYGESYMGFTQWAVAAAMLRDHPAEAPEALVLHITMPDFGAITWDHGAFSLRNALGWSYGMSGLVKGGLGMLRMLRPGPKLARAFDVLPLGEGDTAATGSPIAWYQDWVGHEKLTDHYWAQQSHTASVPEVSVPVMMLTGWYDIFLPWQLDTYAQLVAAGHQPWLTVGPWGHVTRSKDGLAHQTTVAFLEQTFAGRSAVRPTPVHMYQTGAEQWHDLPSWPPPAVTSQPWTLGGDNTIGATPTAGGTTRFHYDPEHPTPSLGGPSLQPDTLPVDNAAHERRGDVATFRSEPLTAALELAGRPVARLRIRSSAASFDVFVRITDVGPDGRSMSVCDGIRRVGSIATADTDPAPDGDGFRVVEAPLWDTFHCFPPGHRVGVQVSAGAHPRYARNPGTGEPASRASATVTAVQDISHDGPDASRIDLPVWNR